MAISPVGPVGVSPQPAPSGDDRRSDPRTTHMTGGVSSVDGAAGDRVVLSETARGIASAVAQDEPRLHLSPSELRAMIAPNGETQRLKSPQGTDDSSSNTEERHVR
jgi:hypothetical protein